MLILVLSYLVFFHDHFFSYPVFYILFFPYLGMYHTHSVQHIHRYNKTYYWQVYNLYSYIPDWKLFIQYQLTYDDLHHTWSLWTIYSPFKVIKQLNPIGVMETSTKPNCNICMQERLTILKKIRDKRVIVMNKNLKIYGACWHKTTFRWFFQSTDNPVFNWWKG